MYTYAGEIDAVEMMAVLAIHIFNPVHCNVLRSNGGTVVVIGQKKRMSLPALKQKA